MKPISYERLQWLYQRQTVLESVIVTLKTYMQKHMASISSTQIQLALSNSQAEFLQNMAEIEVLTQLQVQA